MTSDVNAEEGWRDQIPSVAPARDTGDSEWEYEYDENDTEDFFMTMDLTSHTQSFAQPNNNPRQQDAATDGETLQQEGVGSTIGDPHNPPNGNGTNPQQDSRAPSNHDLESETEGPAIERSANIPSSHQNRSADPETGSSPLQILDLHSANPLVSYCGRTYSCQWASALGTDLHFAVPPRETAVNGSTAEGNLNDQALSERASSGARASPQVEPRLDLIARTPFRLVGTPSQIKKQHATAPSESLQARRSQISTTTPNAGTSTTKATEGNYLADPRDPGSAATRLSFFERLRDMKRKRGETDLDEMLDVDDLPNNTSMPEKELVSNQRRFAVEELIGAADDGQNRHSKANKNQIAGNENTIANNEPSTAGNANTTDSNENTTAPNV